MNHRRHVLRVHRQLLPADLAGALGLAALLGLYGVSAQHEQIAAAREGVRRVQLERPDDALLRGAPLPHHFEHEALLSQQVGRLPLALLDHFQLFEGLRRPSDLEEQVGILSPQLVVGRIDLQRRFELVEDLLTTSQVEGGHFVVATDHVLVDEVLDKILLAAAPGSRSPVRSSDASTADHPQA